MSAISALPTHAASHSTGRKVVRGPRTGGLAGVVNPPRSASATLPVGIYARLRDRRGADLQATLDRLRTAEVSITREDFVWSSIEPRPGQYRWQATDSMVAAAAGAGIRLIAVPSATPAWAGATWNTAPAAGDARDAYARFVRALVVRYGSNGEFWALNPQVPEVPIELYDIWNEPYSPDFWAGGSPDPAAYAGMFKTAVAAARPADPKAKFMLEADTATYPPAAPAPFLSAMLAAVPDLPAYADYVSVHPYSTAGWSPAYCTQGWEVRYEVCRVKNIRRTLDAHGAKRVGIWITEIGWSTSPGGDSRVSEAVQARRVRQMFALVRGPWRGLVSGMVWYAYQTPERDPSQRNDWYGLVHPDGTPKPAWAVFRSESRAMWSSAVARARSASARRARRRR